MCASNHLTAQKKVTLAKFEAWAALVSSTLKLDPKDGELCLGKAKPRETLVEACRSTDMQVIRLNLSIGSKN